MFLIIYARNWKENDGAFEATVFVPEGSNKLCDVVLERKDGKTLPVQVGHTSSSDILVVIIEDGSRRLHFHLHRNPIINPRFFWAIAMPQDTGDKWRFTKTGWRVSAKITQRQEENMVYRLIDGNPGLTAIQLGKLFKASIGETLKRLAVLGRVERKNPSQGGRWRYYPLERGAGSLPPSPACGSYR